MKYEYEEFTLANVEFLSPDEDTSDLYCISVDSPQHEFLIGYTLVPTHNTDELKEANNLRAEAKKILGDIARLGRAAGVHLVIATQRNDASIFGGEFLQNLAMRIACGHMGATASLMCLGTPTATTTPSTPKGRAVISANGLEERMQVYFAEQSWIDEWLARRGKNPDGTPIKPEDKKETLTNDKKDTQPDYSGLSESERLEHEVSDLEAQWSSASDSDTTGQIEDSMRDDILAQELGYDPTGGIGRIDPKKDNLGGQTDEWDESIEELF